MLQTLLLVALLHLTSAQTLSYIGETSNDGKKNGRGEELMPDGTRYIGFVPFGLDIFCAVYSAHLNPIGLTPPSAFQIQGVQERQEAWERRAVSA
jgi:hypothetical protein